MAEPLQTSNLPPPKFEFSVIIDIDLPGFETNEHITKTTDDPGASDERESAMAQRDRDRQRSIDKITWLVERLLEPKGQFWIPDVYDRFHIDEHLGPFTHTLIGLDGQVIYQNQFTFWNWDYLDCIIATLKEAPLLDITESSDGTDKYLSYDLSDDWQTVVHRKLAGIITREAFDEMVELLELGIDCLNTGGMLGGPGAEPWYSCINAVALGGSAEGAIISVYACPFPTSDEDEAWLLNGHTKEEIAASEELQAATWKRAQQFFEEYPNWWR